MHVKINKNKMDANVNYLDKNIKKSLISIIDNSGDADKRVYLAMHLTRNGQNCFKDDHELIAIRSKTLIDVLDEFAKMGGTIRELHDTLEKLNTYAVVCRAIKEKHK